MNERNELDQAFADRDHAREERDTLLAALKVAVEEVWRFGHGSLAIELRAVIAKAEGR